MCIMWPFRIVLTKSASILQGFYFCVISAVNAETFAWAAWEFCVYFAKSADLLLWSISSNESQLSFFVEKKGKIYLQYEKG